ncbi:MAG: hypothetical protein QOJ06_2761, partial [Pseudonocardiales bacterium]|nr:hypothetical protein [Pseudonocardiales bacterium]
MELICGRTTPYRGPASFSIISTPSACRPTAAVPSLGKAHYAGVPDNQPTDDVCVFDWLFAAGIST